MPAERRVLVVHTPRSSDPLDVAMLTHLAAALHPHDVAVATTEPGRTRRLTGLPTLPADGRRVVGAARLADAVVVVDAHLGATAPRGALRLRELAALAVTTRLTGTTLALLGTTVSSFASRAQNRAAAAIALSGDVTVASGEASAQALVRLGVPAPVRVAPDPVLLGVPTGRPPVAVRDDLAVVVDGASAASGALDLAGLVTAVAHGLPSGPPSRVLVHPWNGGHAHDADLHAAAELRTLLRDQGLAARLARPAQTIDEVRRGLARAGLVVATHRHAVLAAVAAGLPTVHLGTGHHRPDLLTGLDVPHASPGERLTDDDVQRLVRAAHTAAGGGPAAVESARCEAQRSVELLAVLLEQGTRTPAGDPGASALHPIGVLR